MAAPPPHQTASPHWFRQPVSIDVRHVGVEREPVVVIDGASGDPDALIAIASGTAFAPASSVGSGYPGLLAPAPMAYLDAMVRFVLPLIQAHFATGPVMPARARGNFSLVTTPSDRLSPDQSIPHVDTTDPLQFATVHFLSAGNPDGTGFFRHRTTGFEVVDEARLPAYSAAIDRERADRPPPGYCGNSDPHHDVIGTVEARCDRLVLYRASLLHSGLISCLSPDAHDPRRGRLTGNLFLQCRARS